MSNVTWLSSYTSGNYDYVSVKLDLNHSGICKVNSEMMFILSVIFKVLVLAVL